MRASSTTPGAARKRDRIIRLLVNEDRGGSIVHPLLSEYEVARPPVQIVVFHLLAGVATSFLSVPGRLALPPRLDNVYCLLTCLTICPPEDNHGTTPFLSVDPARPARSEPAVPRHAPCDA